MNDTIPNPNTTDSTYSAGASAPAPGPIPIPPPAGPRPLLRNPDTRLGGVASGLAVYLGVDVALMRLLFVVVTIMGGWGLLAYLAAWIIVPKAETWPPVWPPAPPVPPAPAAPAAPAGPVDPIGI